MLLPLFTIVVSDLGGRLPHGRVFIVGNWASSCQPEMSDMGQSRSFRAVPGTFANPSRTEVARRSGQVRNVPFADINGTLWSRHHLGWLFQQRIRYFAQLADRR